ncbi:MAG: pyridoxal phosphate-dependent aminotransferase [Acetobacteraceae bacterium]
MPELARRLARVQVAASTTMTIRARELRAQGIDVVSLTLGEPAFATPRPAIEAGYQAALRGETKYPPQDGTPALKAAIQRKFHRDSGLDFALDEICVGNGGKQCIYNALAATVDPGDEVVIPVPSWNAYPLMTTLLDGVPVSVPCPQNNGFKPRAEDIEAAITPRSKWLILNNPNNPSGAACSAEDLGAIAEVLRRHPRLWIMSDDMYEHLLFDGFRHATMAAVAPDLADRTLTISGVSKTYAMTGWRIGFAGGPRALIRAMVNMQGQITAGVSSVGQAAAAAALDGAQDGVGEMIAAYQRRRDLAVEMLNACRGLNCHKPEGAFYVFPNIAGCLDKTSPAGRGIATDADFARALLEEAHVALVPGASYGMSPYVRVSTAAEEAVLVEGCRRIGRFCESLR